MTTAKTVGAVSSQAAESYAIDWQAIRHNVRRPSAYRAGNEGRPMGQGASLASLLTHSYSGKVLAVRRVTENEPPTSFRIEAASP
jgi:RNA-directed DNA polymerase